MPRLKKQPCTPGVPYESISSPSTDTVLSSSPPQASCTRRSMQTRGHLARRAPPSPSSPKPQHFPRQVVLMDRDQFADLLAARAPNTPSHVIYTLDTKCSSVLMYQLIVFLFAALVVLRLFSLV
ncbi:hypothetical protein DL95DRAFT_389930, partial [Leptodontidium sp. 2 PMI_412]